MDRVGNTWVVFDIDGTGEAARQRAFPRPKPCPRPDLWLDEVSAPGYRGRKLGGLFGHGQPFLRPRAESRLGLFGNRGNGRYRGELRKGLIAIGRYLTAHRLPQGHALLHIFGYYGTGAVLADLAGFAFVTRGKSTPPSIIPWSRRFTHLPPDQRQQWTAKPGRALPLRLS
jgi:hypothetical protein